MLLKIAILLIFLIPVIILSSYSQNSDSLIFVQNILRDSDGNLVTSLEVTKIGC